MESDPNAWILAPGAASLTTGRISGRILAETCANPPSRRLAAPGKVELRGDVHEKRSLKMVVSRDTTMPPWRDYWLAKNRLDNRYERRDWLLLTSIMEKGEIFLIFQGIFCFTLPGAQLFPLFSGFSRQSIERPLLCLML